MDDATRLRLREAVEEVIGMAIDDPGCGGWVTVDGEEVLLHERMIQYVNTIMAAFEAEIKEAE